MAGRAEWEVQIDSNVKQLLGDAEQLRSELNDLKNKKYKIDLDIDSKKLENVITKLDKMLDNLGKGTNDFNQFKELGKYLNDISSELTNFKTLNSTFSNIESHLSSLKSTISDVGDGQEFSPLLKMINDVKQSIVSLEKASSKMKLDFKFDLGSNEKDERQMQKIAEIRARQLESYRSLFNKMKFSGFATTSALNFYEPEGSTIEQLISLYKQNIKEMNKNRPNKKKNNDILDLEKEVKNANNQFNNVTRKIKTDSENPIESLFGKTDLTPVIEQLKSIESAIKDISKAATGLKDALSKGLNVNTSVEEIEKLTNRVKELEQELNKIKTNSHNVDMSSGTSNIHTQNVSKQKLSGKDAIKSTINSAKELDNVLEKIDIPTESFDDILSKLDLAESKLSDIVKITKQAHADGEGKFYNSYTLTDKYGSSEVYGESSQTDKGQLLKYSYIEFDAKQEKKNAELSKKQAAQAIKQIVDADNKLRELEAVKSDMLELNSDASTENIDKLIAKQKDYIDTLEETNKNIINQNDLIDARKKSKEDYDLNKNAKQEKKNAELSKKQAERANKELDKTQKILNDFDKRKNISNDLSLGFENVKDDISKLNKELTDGAISIDKYKEKLSSITSDYSKNLKNQENEIKKELNSAQKFFESNDKNYKAINNRKPESSDRNPKYAENLEKYQMAIANLDAKLKALSKKDIITSDDIQNVKDLKKNIDTCRASLEKMSSSEKGTSALSAAKEIDTMTKYLNKFTGISKEARQSIEALIKSLEFDRSAQNIARVHTEFLKLSKMERLAGREVSGLKSIISEKFRYGLGADIAGMFGFYDVINVGKQALNIIKELDDSLVDLKKTTAMSSGELNEFYFDSNNVAKQMGITTKEVIDQASSWSRLGYNTKDAATEMAKTSAQFAAISPGMDVDTAQEGLISIMKAWNVDVSKVESEITDKINSLGNSMAEENQDIVEGMKRSAAALASVGTSYTDAFALFSGIQEVLQNPEVSGRALKSISMRLRGYDEETEELSSDLENITGELINLTKTAEHAQGVSIFKEGSTTEFKSLVDYFGEINEIWDEMSQKQQNDFLQKAFGKTQAQAGSALIQNYSAVKKALDVMENSAGSADREMSVIQESISFKLNALKETWVGTAQQLFDKKSLGTGIDMLTKLSEVLGFVADKAGILGTLSLGLGATLGFKNVGRLKVHSLICFKYANNNMCSLGY